MTTALVTGAAGFIGSHLVDRLIREGLDVVGIDDLSGGSKVNVNKKSTFYEVSVCDESQLNLVFEEAKPKYVYHLAAYAAEGLSHFIRRYNYTNNVVGSMNVINGCVKHKVKSLVFTSSIAVYGGNASPLTERMIPNPIDPYGIAKYTVEMDLEAARRMFGLNYVILRPHNVYGERQNLGDNFRNVIGIFIRKALAGENLPIFGDGLQTRAFTYIKDIIPQMAQSAWNPKMQNRAWNIGNDAYESVIRVAEYLSHVMSKVLRTNYLPARIEEQHVYADNSRINKIIPVKRWTPLWEGLAKMVKWARTTNIVTTPLPTFIELAKNLPPSWKKIIEEEEKCTTR